MDIARLAELLQPFLAGSALPPGALEQLRRYLELLLRWNARVNLTALRAPESIVTRHFGESLFAAQVLAKEFLPSPPKGMGLADVGSGAGFPGVPIKLAMPQLELTLIESHHKKAAFLRELLRALSLGGAQVYCGRADEWPHTADIVTLRAVEQFRRALPVAAGLVAGGGRLCLLIGARQLEAACQLSGWKWSAPVAVPASHARVVVIGQRTQEAASDLRIPQPKP